MVFQKIRNFRQGVVNMIKAKHNRLNLNHIVICFLITYSGNLTAGTLTNISISATDYNPGATDVSYTFNYDNEIDIPKAGKWANVLKLMLPTGFSFNSSFVALDTGGTTVVSGQCAFIDIEINSENKSCDFVQVNNSLLYIFIAEPISANSSIVVSLNGIVNNANSGGVYPFRNFLISDDLNNLFDRVSPLPSINLSAPNTAPIITGTPATTVAQDVAYSFTPAVSDVDAGDTQVFSISNKPAWATFSTTTGALTGTPVNGDIGVTSGIVITVTDSATATASLAAFALTVSNTNDTPIITGTPATTVAQDVAYSFTPAVSDVDAGDTQVFSISNKPAWATFSTTTGALTGTPVNGDIGVTSGIVITVTDSATATASLAAFNLIVTNVNDPAVITGDITGTALEDGAAIDGVLVIVDPDVGDTPVFIAQTNSIGTYGALTISQQGLWRYLINNELDAVQSLVDAETVTDVFTVTSSVTGLDAIITITITGVNDAAVITEENAQSISNDGTLISGALRVTDADADQNPVFNTQLLASGTHGTFSIDALGDWSYLLDNSALPPTRYSNIEDIFTVDTSVTNLSIKLKVSIRNGSYNAVVTGYLGKIGDGSVFEEQENIQGNYGTFSLNVWGYWTYRLDRTRAAVLALPRGEIVQDEFTTNATNSVSNISRRSQVAIQIQI